ncbi:hypothetical protein ATE84_4685 [Aquimarina sp. MAR_2010_214]|uniref:hypothetical protein n=1 Tax=Aquimarina sp. MAR_2010_214 TaxID=1250026 RepID=UPI000C710B0A|nr:hypothetical protein [Aquimarina sp. MAR_2010_214]PKV52565.1 hypothetical protein ATE84_4685 [Aquimarina sp. MAR_2010_214]
MKSHNLYLFLFLAILCFNCKNNKANSDKTDSNIIDTNIKDISELSYIEIYRALFVDNNGGFDAHGDLYGQDAVSYLSFSEESGSCGNAIYLSSTSNDSIVLALKSSFNFPGNPENEMLRAYILPPKEKISVGSSKFCYNGKEYNIKKEIISAGFGKN